MKIFYFLFLLLFIIGCKKITPINDAKVQLYLQKIDSVKIGEPVSLNFGDDDVTTKVVWTISPSDNHSIKTIANNATIEFTNAGTYIVTATMGNVYAQYVISVLNLKYLPNYGNNFSFIASKLVGINANEPVVFKVFNAATTNTISWTISTSIPYTIIRDNANNAATIIFAASGIASVSADDGVNKQRRTVWIGDSINSASLDTANFLLGDKLLLVPSVEQLAGGKKLVITAKSTRKYNCDSDKILSFNTNSDYQIDYGGVIIAPETCSKRSIASCVNSFKNMPIGTHNFTVNYANKTYRGTVTLDALGKYTFDWQNNSDVIIAPLFAQ